jgi:sequestosome 1
MDFLQSTNNTMSEKNSVSFKVTLVSDDSSRKVEVRRFVVDQSASTSLPFLKEKLVSLFPTELRRADAKLSWRDEDGDDVTIGSDEELIIALTEMKGPVYKLEVCVAAPKVVFDEADKANNGNATGEVHQGVSCDGCNQEVVGFRYKCVVCPDYDLCGKCETKGAHPGHNMIRIATPETIWPKHFFNRLNRLQSRATKVTSGEAEWTRRGGGCVRKAAKEDTGEKESNEQPKLPDGPCRGPHGRGGRRGHGGHGGPWMGFGQSGVQVQGPWGQQQQQHGQQQQQGPWTGLGSHFEAHAKAHAEANPKSTAEEGEATNQAEYSHDMLRNLGQMVAAALDPFGVDVHIDIETPEGKKDCLSKDDVAKNPEAAKEAGEEKPEEKAKEEAEIIEPEKPKTPKEATPEHEDGEWTVLGKSASPEPPKEAMKIPMDGTLYPKLITTENKEPLIATEKLPEAKEAETPAAVPTAPLEVASHPNPRIQVALQAMLNMGFTNEGGWLVQLLETKEGDIGKVLDMLQPVRPTRV